jgi:hypothetical protein
MQRALGQKYSSNNSQNERRYNGTNEGKLCGSHLTEDTKFPVN